MSKAVDLVIKDGFVVSGGQLRAADVAIGNGVIQEIGRQINPPEGAEVIDASGKYLLPGAVDVHVHFDAPPNHVDNLQALSRTAAWGGTTTIAAFLFIRRGRGLVETLHGAIADGESNSFLDYTFHPCMLDTKNQFHQIPEAVAMGITSFKMVMTYAREGSMTADDALLDAMEVIAANGSLAMVHCENGVIIDHLQNKCHEEGRLGPDEWLATQPIVLETEAINRAIAIASMPGCPLYIPHISTGAALGPVIAAKDRGQRVYAETCPTYLLLTHEEVRRRGDIAKIGPPLRSDEDRESLWEALADGVIDVVATDHVAKDKRGGRDIINAAFGAPGAETLLTVMYDAGVNGGRITLPRLVELISENPARIFGLYPRKGTLQVGSDADLVVFDPKLRKTLTHTTQHTNATYTLYEGRECIGAPVLSLQRGQVVLGNGELRAPAGQGNFIVRKPAIS